MECQKCPMIEECNNIQESIKNTKMVTGFSVIKVKFCPLAIAVAKTINDMKF